MSAVTVRRKEGMRCYALQIKCPIQVGRAVRAFSGAWITCQSVDGARSTPYEAYLMLLKQ